ncbi:MAG: phosphate butyryltransferase [Lachnospiraceae bacterium]|jgi:phosphate butyryltransferase|nr:phosphate butyryltransferase [Lachnospiraceae bacterium]MCI1727312.1 phosphate butyryltransferase [Lachnospiraceae bacterium]
MALKSFYDIMFQVQTGSKKRRRVAIAGAADEQSLLAALEARVRGVTDPVLIGNRKQILKLLKEFHTSVPEEDIIDVKDPVPACEAAVACVREGRADVLMKGMVETKDFLKAAVSEEKGLSRGKLMSHVALFEIPGKKLISVVDGGMVCYPTLKEKKEIIVNTVEVFHKLGYRRPKVAVLACVEFVNSGMPETVDAEKLKEMNRKGQIKGCIVDGPISYDCAVSREIADLKEYDSPVAGHADILVAPDIHTGNIMGKIYTCDCHARMAGFVTGAKCPIVLTSRGSSAEEKYLSIVLSAAAV